MGSGRTRVEPDRGIGGLGAGQRVWARKGAAVAISEASASRRRRREKEVIQS